MTPVQLLVRLESLLEAVKETSSFSDYAETTVLEAMRVVKTLVPPIDTPSPQESATVKEMRESARTNGPMWSDRISVNRWANELEEANKRIAELETTCSERASLTQIHLNQLRELQDELQSRQPAPSRELAAIVVGACLDKSEEIHAFECTDDAIAFVRDDANDARILTRVHSWHYHPSQKGVANGD